MSTTEISKEIQVCGLLADTDGCGYYRLILPLRTISELNMAQTSYSMDAREFHTRVPDILIGQRVMLPGISDRWQKIAAGKKVPWFDSRPALVYELDDDLFSLTPDVGPDAWKFYSQPGLMDNVLRNIEASDAVIVSETYLRDQMLKYHDRVYVMHNYIDEKVMSTPPVYPWADEEGRISIGFSGGRSHAADFRSILPAIESIMRRRENVMFKFSGTDYSSAFMRATNRTLLRDGWIKDVVKYTQMHDWNIGVAPLADTPYNRSKSRIRVLEYMARGIPVVAEDMEPYQGLVRDGETGFLASGSVDWMMKLRLLIDSEDLRRTMGGAGMAMASYRTIQENAYRVRNLYLEILNDLELT